MKHIRMSITVPEDVRDELAAKCGDVNWSGIATAAFRNVIDGVAPRDILVELRRCLVALWEWQKTQQEMLPPDDLEEAVKLALMRSVPDPKPGQLYVQVYTHGMSQYRVGRKVERVGPDPLYKGGAEWCVAWTDPTHPLPFGKSRYADRAEWSAWVVDAELVN